MGTAAPADLSENGHVSDAKRLLAGPHVTARTERPPSYPPRFPVPDDKVAWETAFAGYDPPYHVDLVVLENDRSTNPRGWADPENLDHVTRAFYSLEGVVRFDELGRPLNPLGRTGICGRGLLGKWGANFAADPLITREAQAGGPLEVLVIERADSGLWAFPGGMVDAGESATDAMTRELFEETGVRIDMSGASIVYRGYVDGRRNTDNAWLETIAGHVHLGEAGRDAIPNAGDDARSARWEPVTPELIARMHKTHGRILADAVKRAGFVIAGS